MPRRKTSVLIKRWVCLDDGELITDEDDYCFHVTTYPKHRVVPGDAPVVRRTNLRLKPAIGSLSPTTDYTEYSPELDLVR